MLLVMTKAHGGICYLGPPLLALVETKEKEEDLCLGNLERFVNAALALGGKALETGS